MSRVLTRSQLGRVSRWVRTHHHPSSSSPLFSSLKRCSTATTTTTTTTVTPPAPSSSEMQKKFPDHVVPLTCTSSASESGFCNVIVVGTCHISQKSCDEVKEIINSFKPEVVFLELCSKRASTLKTTHLKVPTTKEMIAKIWKKKTNTLGLLISLAYVLVGSTLEVVPGSEFRVAYEEAKKYGGKVVLGDRPVEITLKRAWRKMPFSEKIKFLTLSTSKIEGSRFNEDLPLKLHTVRHNMNMDMATRLTQDLGMNCPTLQQAFLHERDIFMCAKLLEVAKKSSSVVAVVGMGHLPGIKKHWQQPISVKDLLTVPPPPLSIMSAIFYVGSFMAGVATASRYL